VGLTCLGSAQFFHYQIFGVICCRSERKFALRTINNQPATRGAF